ncbi:MAG: diguanylate cyclase [Xanthomonadales bacterium]|jgi:diguanylate cyclase|nr:diguanylate cyclase [Xanthomonadales bacterium]
MESKNEHWKDKYLDLIDQVERDKARGEQMDATLRRAISRLSIACRGLDNRLDDELTRFSTAVRQKVDVDSLGVRIDALSEAIVGLDHAPDAPTYQPATSPPAIAPAPSATEARVLDNAGPALKKLLDNVSLGPELVPQLVALREQVLPTMSESHWGPVIETFLSLLSTQQAQLAGDKANLERMLEQVDGRLDELAVYLMGDKDARKDERDSRDALTTQLHGEVDRLGTHARQATELTLLQQHVSTRISAINAHVQDFRSREEDRIVRLEERGELMRSRIDELERETTNLRQSLRYEQVLAATDNLTRIPNRMAYQEAIEQEFARWSRYPRPVALAVWDIDHFKSINDQYGHKAGDKVLFAVAQVLRKHLRNTDFVARVGGEEFVAILPGASTDQALRVVEELRRKVSHLGFHFQGKPLQVTMSCGIAQIQASDTPDSLFERADRGMYRAKENGRNQSVVESA